MIKKLLFIKSHRRKIIEKISFIISCTFAVFNGALWIISKSMWYLMLTIYYVSLSFARGRIHFYKRKNKRKSEVEDLILYRNNGIYLLIMNFALGTATLFVVIFKKTFKYSGIFIYGVAVYSIMKIFLAIINISKVRGTKNYIEISYRTINLVDASFSIYAFQTAFVNQLSKESNDFFISNLLMGVFVVLFSLSVGVFTLIKAKKEICDIDSN